jgi:hypothetical protein
MLKMEQIQRELKVILDFDDLFVCKSERYLEEKVGFELRKLRRQELLGLAE